MKKRILSALCALALCAGLLAFSLPARAADTPCFMAVNNTLLPLESQFIPITVSGQYYIPYTVLDSGATGVSLGIHPIYNPILNTLMIYDLDQVLTFDLAAGTCQDRDGSSIQARAVTRNGRVYVPARLTSEYFGLIYSATMTTYGPLVRIRSGASNIDDFQFPGLAQAMMEDRLRDWREAQAEEETSSSSSASSPSSSSSAAPTPTPSPAPAQEPETEPEEPEADRSGVCTYLAFRADTTDGLEELLDELERAQVQALFFFPAEELAGYDGAVRAVLCEGHGVGLLVSGASTQEISAQAAEGNRVLTQIAHLNTCTVLAPDVQTEAQREELRSGGLLCWNTDVSALPDGRSASAQAAAVLDSAGAYSGAVYILSDTTAAGSALTGRLLSALLAERYDLRLAVETAIK